MEGGAKVACKRGMGKSHICTRHEKVIIVVQIVAKRGLNNITHDDLVSEITPKGRSLVPDVVKKELLVKIQTFLSHQNNM